MTLTESLLRESLRRELTQRARKEAPPGAGRASAVLVPLFERDGDVYVWLLRRAAGMRQHGGQVAFPGGKHELDDASLLVTALREAEEEIGLDPALLDVLGPLDDTVTVTGFIISPYVAWISGAHVVEANPAEVSRVFAAPLRTFLAPAPRFLPRLAYLVDGELVWGATAAIARALGDIVRTIAQ